MNQNHSPLIFESKNSISNSVMFFHGGTSNNESLRPLAPYFEKQLLVLPQGTYTNEKDSYDWFHFVENSLKIDEESIEKSISIITPFIDEIKNRTSGSLFIGGLSQGAIFAGELFKRQSEKFKGLFLLSGFIEKNGVSQFQGKEVHIAHGFKDPLIPIEMAEYSADYFKQRGANVDFSSYDMGHEIIDEEIITIQEWLNLF